MRRNPYDVGAVRERPREQELRATIQRLREANRRLQARGAELERDKLIVALRAERDQALEAARRSLHERNRAYELLAWVRRIAPQLLTRAARTP